MLIRTKHAAIAAAVLACLISPNKASAAPLLLVDVATGRVVYEHDASLSWHPASITKLMTARIALKAMRLGLATADTPVTISQRAAAVAPSKLGSPPGTVLRLEDALRIMLTRSTNDVATAIAESLAGSETSFVSLMNSEAAKLGMNGTRFVNASGLPARDQVTTAEDLAILARHLLLDFPDHASLFATPSLQAGGRTLRNTNGLLGRYPGADGMKTGYVCASGFNIVTTATRDGTRLLAVVLGAPSVKAREAAAARLMDLGFADGIRSSGRPLASHVAAPSAAEDLSKWKCGKSYPQFQMPGGKTASTEPSVSAFDPLPAADGKRAASNIAVQAARRF